MGAIYDPSEAKELTDALKQNIERGEEMIDRMLSGSHHLVQAVDGKMLSGAAYNAGKGLFEEVIIPIIDKAKEALDEVKSDLHSFESQVNNAKHSPYGNNLLDEDVLNQKLEIYRTQQILTSDFISDMQAFGNSHPAGSDLSNMYADHVNVYTGFLGSIEEDIQKTEDKLRLLAEFNSATNDLFTNSEEAFKMVKSAMTVLERTNVDPNTGAYHLPKGIDKSWFKNPDSEILLINKLDGKGLSEEDQEKYQTAVSDIIISLEKKGWSDKGIAAYIKTLNQINENSHAAGDLPSVIQYLENTKLSSLLLLNPNLLPLSKYKENGVNYYFVNGEPNYLLTKLSKYIPNLGQIKEATPEDAAKTAKVLQDKVIVPGESQALLVADELIELSDLAKITDSSDFINVLEDTKFTNTTNKVYNFVSDKTGLAAAQADFDSLGVTDVITRTNGTITGKLPNGDMVNLHAGRSVNFKPSLEIFDQVSRSSIKIRYLGDK